MTDQKLLKEKSKRTVNFNIRLTQSEHDQLKQMAGGKRLASFMRDKCLLDITDVNPIVWGTNFTRFINVNRISLPD